MGPGGFIGRRLSVIVVALALSGIASSPAVAASKGHRHSKRHFKPDPCLVAHKAKAKHKRKRALADAAAPRHHRKRVAATHRSRCRTRIHRMAVAVHRTNGPYPPVVAHEPDEQEAPVLPIGPYRARHGGRRVAMPEVSGVRAALAPRVGAILADTSSPVDILATVDPATGGLGATYADQESSEAVVGNLMFFTSNWRAGYSTDFGKTFTALSPFTTFPAASAGFCCDQVVIYSPEVDRVFWILQYSNDANGENIIRVAWASPNRIATDAVHAWNWIDLDSTSLVGTGKCFDQPHVGLAPGYLMMQINQCVGGKVQQSLFFRLHLSDVDKPQMNFEYAAGGVVSARPARSNSGDIRYFVGQKNTSTLRVYHWKQNEGYVYYDDIGIPTIATSNWTSNTPGGVDWLTRQQNSQGTAVTGVTVARGKVWATWSAARSSIDNNGNAHQVHTQPAIEGALISLNADGSAASATPLTYYNDSVAVAMPDLTTNADGEVGLAFEQGGGGAAYPAHGVGILTGTPKFAFDITGNTDNDTAKCGAGCTGDPAGDYSTVGIEYPASQCFTSSGVAHATAKTAPSPRSLPRLSIFARRGTQDCTPSGTFGPSPASSQMTIGCPAQVTAGDSFNVSGSLTPARSGAPIKVVFTRPDASLDQHDISTDAASHYATDESTTTDQVGTWRVVASWPGDSNTSPSSAGCAVRVVAPPPPNLLPSTITIYCPSSSDPANPDVFQSGETVTTTGGVYTQSTKAANTPVVVDYVPESANDAEFRDTVMTNSNGDYSDSVMLPSGFPHGGYWDIYTYWNGNAQYQGATSGTCRIYQHQAIG